MTALTPAKRILVAFLAASATSAFVFLSWGFVGFAIAASLRGVRSETVGYATIVVAPAGASLAFIAAGLAAIPAFGPRPWLRWVVLSGVFFVLGVAVLGGIAATA